MRVRRDRWGVPHIEAGSARRPLVRRGLLPRPGPALAARLLPPRRLRPGLRDGGRGGAADRPADADAGDPPHRRARGGDARPRAARRCSSASARGSTRPPRAPGRCPSRCSCCASSWSPGARSTSSASASCSPSASRPTGSRSCCAPTWRARSAPSWRRKLDPGYPADNPVVTQEAWSGDGLALAEQIDAVRRSIGLAAEASGSNNWAVSGELSATGSPLIAGDPHLPPSMPGIWYQVGLTLGDRFVRGASLPGMPGVYMGQNNDVCWTFTNVMADVQDLFIERVEGDRYLFEDEWRPLGDRRARRSRSRAATRPRCSTVRITHHGPIVNEALGADEAEPLALRWLTLDQPTAFTGHVRAATRSSRGRSWSPALEGHTLARLEPDLGRPPRLDRLQADRPPAAAQGRLPRPAEAGLDRRVRVGGDDPLRGTAGGGRSRERLPRHRQQPDRRRRVPAPHHQRVARRLPRRADRAAARAPATSTTSTSFEAMQSDDLSIPGLEAARRLGRLHAARASAS